MITINPITLQQFLELPKVLPIQSLTIGLSTGSTVELAPQRKVLNLTQKGTNNQWKRISTKIPYENYELLPYIPAHGEALKALTEEILLNQGIPSFYNITDTNGTRCSLSTGMYVHTSFGEYPQCTFSTVTNRVQSSRRLPDIFKTVNGVSLCLYDEQDDEKEPYQINPFQFTEEEVFMDATNNGTIELAQEMYKTFLRMHKAQLFTVSDEGKDLLFKGVPNDLYE